MLLCGTTETILYISPVPHLYNMTFWNQEDAWNFESIIWLFYKMDAMMNTASNKMPIYYKE